MVGGGREREGRSIVSQMAKAKRQLGQTREIREKENVCNENASNGIASL